MSFSEYRKTQNLKPIELKNKEKIYLDLMNIEHSWTGRMDTSVGNTFIMESVQLIVNSMELFELGYFDCAWKQGRPLFLSANPYRRICCFRIFCFNGWKSQSRLSHLPHTHHTQVWQRALSFRISRKEK